MRDQPLVWDKALVSYLLDSLYLFLAQVYREAFIAHFLQNCFWCLMSWYCRFASVSMQKIAHFYSWIYKSTSKYEQASTRLQSKVLCVHITQIYTTFFSNYIVLPCSWWRSLASCTALTANVPKYNIHTCPNCKAHNKLTFNQYVNLITRLEHGTKACVIVLYTIADRFSSTQSI